MFPVSILTVVVSFNMMTEVAPPDLNKEPNVSLNLTKALLLPNLMKPWYHKTDHIRK